MFSIILKGEIYLNLNILTSRRKSDLPSLPDMSQCDEVRLRTIMKKNEIKHDAMGKI